MISYRKTGFLGLNLVSMHCSLQLIQVLLSSCIQPGQVCGCTQHSTAFSHCQWLRTRENPTVWMICTVQYGPFGSLMTTDTSILFMLGKWLVYNLNITYIIHIYIYICMTHSMEVSRRGDITLNCLKSSTWWFSSKKKHHDFLSFSFVIEIYHWLVVYLPLWKIWKSIGMVIPNKWKNKSHVPNHQPDIMRV